MVRTGGLFFGVRSGLSESEVSSTLLGSGVSKAGDVVWKEVQLYGHHTLKLYYHKNEKPLMVEITAFMRRIYELLMWYTYIQYTNTSGDKFLQTALLF